MYFYLSHRVENSIVSLSLPPRSGLAVPYLEHTAATLSAADSEGGERLASGRSKETISQLKQAFNEANLPLSLNQGEKMPGSFIIYLHYSLSLDLFLSPSLLPIVTQLLQSAIQSRDLLRVSPGKVEGHGCQHPLELSWGEFSVCCVEAHSLLNQHRNLATKERYIHVHAHHSNIIICTFFSGTGTACIVTHVVVCMYIVNHVNNYYNNNIMYVY